MDKFKKCKIIPARLSMMRSNLGWKQKDLAQNITEYTGCSVSSQLVSLWETNRRPIPKKYNAAIAELCNCSIAYLCGLNNNPSSEEILESELQIIEIAPENLCMHDSEPVYLEFQNLNHKNAWAIYDHQNSRFVFKDGILPVQGIDYNYVRFYLQKPIYACDLDIQNKNSLDLQSMLNLDRVYVALNSSDEQLRGQYTGWYRHNEYRNGLINSIGLTLPYDGLGISYKAFSPNNINLD